MPKAIRSRLLACASLLAMTVNTAAPAFAAVTGANDDQTRTPIKHVIVIIGENRSFDHVFATYVPPKGSVMNMLSKGIINADGTPGPNFSAARQMTATDTNGWKMAPANKQAYTTLPPPNTAYTPTAPSNTAPPFTSVAIAAAADYGLETSDLPLLTIGASGLPQHSIDTRIANASNLANGPFQLTPGVPYNAYANSPVHRFFQMWQQLDCSAAAATAANPSGCQADLFPWVETTIGAGSNGKPQPANFTDETTGEGATAMGFYNVQQGDMPYFKALADTYAVGDNYHQAIMGGTGANHIAIGFADAMPYSDGNGHLAVPPANQIENPNPASGTNNWYSQDGYSGGSYVGCSSPMQPGIGEIRSYLRKLPHHPDPNCADGAYYLVNNYNPGYYGDGSVNTTTFTIPPSSQRSIANSLDAAQVSWTYYGEGWNAFVSGTGPQVYCNICNPFLYQSSIMTDATKRTTNLKDTTDLYADLANGTLPAVSIVKPGGLNDGHPESSRFDIFEAFTKKILDALQAQPALFADTAVFITVDEGGGYYDSGYVQPVDFFGDGTRIPMIVVSPYSQGKGVVHDYADHASIAKFINANWRLRPITDRSRDNLPNPEHKWGNPYVPVNAPAISDLMGFFDFDHGDHGDRDHGDHQHRDHADNRDFH